MSVELKIKAKHLKLEIGVIRFEENKLQQRISKLDPLIRESAESSGLYGSRTVQLTGYKLDTQIQLIKLNRHRKEKVVSEVRATNLARAMLKGKSYKSVENKRRTDEQYETFFWSKVMPRIAMMYKKYNSDYKVRRQDDLEIMKLTTEWINQ